MSMYFLDDTDDWPEYKIVMDDIHRLEREHVDCHKQLKELSSSLTSDPSNEDLKADMERLNKRLNIIEKRLESSLSMYR